MTQSIEARQQATQDAQEEALYAHGATLGLDRTTASRNGYLTLDTIKGPNGALYRPVNGGSAEGQGQWWKSQGIGYRGENGKWYVPIDAYGQWERAKTGELQAANNGSLSFLQYSPLVAAALGLGAGAAAGLSGAGAGAVAGEGALTGGAVTGAETGALGGFTGGATGGGVAGVEGGLVGGAAGGGVTTGAVGGGLSGVGGAAVAGLGGTAGTLIDAAGNVTDITGGLNGSGTDGTGGTFDFNKWLTDQMGSTNWGNILAGLGQGALGYLGADKMADAYKDISQQYINMGAPYRDTLASSYKPGFDLASQPGYGDAFDRMADISTRSWSARGGNPANNPGIQGGILNDVWNQSYLPALTSYRGQLGQFGGMGLNQSGQAAMAGANYASPALTGIGAGLGASGVLGSNYQQPQNPYSLTFGGNPWGR